MFKFHVLKIIALSTFIAASAHSQLSPKVIPKSVPSPPSSVLFAPWSIDAKSSLQSAQAALQNDLPTIVLIGYWPPTNEMLRKFSPSPVQNPDGWVGLNWRQLGFNIISFFPEFPNGPGIGTGDFMVDYQDTSEDFWQLVPPLNPVAVLSFGRAQANNDWEIELVTRNLSHWNKDFRSPYHPFPSPPDSSYATDKPRYSRIAADAIITKIQYSDLNLNAYSDSNGAGAYLCEYLGYHLSWYQSLHPQQVKFAAHTHIGSDANFSDLELALELMLEVIIQSL